MRYIPLLFLALLCFSCQQDSADHQSAKRPNIIFLVTDDQRWDAMGYMGNDIVQTPHMDSLAEAGTYFTYACVTTSICAISRASFLSGQYARRHGIVGFGTPFTDSAFANTYPALLRDAGYYTGFIGKYGVGAGNEEDLPKNEFDYWKGFTGQGYYWHQDSSGNNVHLTSIMGNQMQDFIETAPDTVPFCLSVSFKAPHVQDEHPDQYLYDSAYQNLYTNVQIPVPETADPKYWEVFPTFFKENNEARNRWEIRFSTPEKYQKSVKGYYRLISGIDKVVGDLTEELKAKNLADNTIIILMGDNGYYLGEHGLAGKWYGHQESLRVPLFIYNPTKKSWQQKKIDDIVLNVDIAPTILSLAGISIPQQMQGKNLGELIENGNQGWRKDFFYEHLFDHPAIPKSVGYVSKEYKLLDYFEQSPQYEEFYDLAKDPLEKHNLILDPEYQTRIDSLRNKMEHMQESLE